MESDVIGQVYAHEYSRLLTRDTVSRLKTNLGLVSNLRAVVTTFQRSCLLSVDRCRNTFAFELILLKV